MTEAQILALLAVADRFEVYAQAAETREVCGTHRRIAKELRARARDAVERRK